MNAKQQPIIIPQESKNDHIILENSRLEQENMRLAEQNKHLQGSLEKQKTLTAQLQLSLLEKHAEINKLLLKNDRLVSEFVRNKPQLRNRGNKVETVRLLAEVAAVIDTAKSKDAAHRWDTTIHRAEQYLAESQVEIDEANFDGASYLASQALDLIQSLQMESGSNGDEKLSSEVVFVSNLPMKVLENSNVRAEPSLAAKILFVQQAGSTVTAMGYNGVWVKIKIKQDGHGWVHYSLLSGANN